MRGTDNSGRRRGSRSLLIFAALWLVIAAGCGPIESLVVIGDAKVSLEAARVADAEKLSPFEFRAAQEYLHKAREEMHLADYQMAIELAEIAFQYSEEARLRAVEDPTRGAARVKPPPRPNAKGKPARQGN